MKHLKYLLATAALLAVGSTAVGTVSDCKNAWNQSSAQQTCEVTSWDYWVDGWGGTRCQLYTIKCKTQAGSTNTISVLEAQIEHLDDFVNCNGTLTRPNCGAPRG